MFKDFSLTVPVGFLLVLGIVVLRSVAPNIFPGYLIYIVLAIFVFWFFSQLDFEILSLFSSHFYVISIFLLLLTLVIGRITHNTIRWIPIGSFSLRPSEIVRPFLLVFFANYLTKNKINIPILLKGLLFASLPALLILIQPSLSVAILTFVGFSGVLIASNFNKKYLLIGIVLLAIVVPISLQVMAPYQKQRIVSFLEPGSDPLGSGYNSIQSTIALGSGKVYGRGLGKGIQTQLAFLPEKQTDFIFSAVGEELGFVGVTFLLLTTFIVLLRLTKYMENSVSPAGRAYISGFVLTYVTQVSIHAAMNIGIFPVTGLPFPLVSAGGSSLLATMMGLGIAVGAYKRT
jgi:rod shape determining protein RodA